MRVRFWGTRGSIATPGPSTLRYGGNTACVEVRSAAGTLVVIDCGTGVRALGQSLVAGGQPLRGHILISHTHWDHIQGLPFFAPLAVPGNEWDIHAPRGLEPSLRGTLAGQMQYSYFPITLEQFGANIRYHDLLEGVFEIGDIKVRTQYLHHPALTLGYRLEADGVALVYACDHEPYFPQLAGGEGRIDGADRRHVEFLSGADLVIHDAQYTAVEYPAKRHWGHSTVEYAAAMCHAAGVRQLALTHHDPLRNDDALDQVLADLRAWLAARALPLDVSAAAEGQTIELTAVGDTVAPAIAGGFSAATPMPAALAAQSVLLGVRTPSLARALGEALQADQIRTLSASDSAAVLRIARHEKPALLIVEENLPGIGGAGLCRAIRAEAGGYAAEVPVVLVGDEENGAMEAAGVTDRLFQPFSAVYARTRIRAWLLRSRCRWLRAPLPDDEEQRLEALHRLGILDTEPEERFDRLTRIASALFDVPVALVSLVDRERQWLKSVRGVDIRSTTRETSFCAHALLQRDVLIVPDALLDDRFADNPYVTGEPRVRFYAGCQLILPCGSCAGTLCILDTRPRDLDEAAINNLRDLARLVEAELTRAG